MQIAESKAFRDRIFLGLTSLPLLQLTSLIHSVDFQDFPYHLKIDVILQLSLQNIPLTAILISNQSFLGIWDPLSIIVLSFFTMGSLQNLFQLYHYTDDGSGNAAIEGTEEINLHVRTKIDMFPIKFSKQSQTRIIS